MKTSYEIRFFMSMLLMALSSVSLVAAETVHYTIYADGGVKMGEQLVTYLPKGLTKVHFIYKNNGRGPEVDEEIQIGSNGFPVVYAGQGTAELGGPTNEHFSLNGTKAEWKTNSEKGEKSITVPSLYIPLTGSLETVSISIGLLSHKKQASLPLLPSGELRQRKLAELTLKLGRKTQNIQLLAQTGLGLAPSFYWATTGKNPRLFGFISSGYMWLIEDPWKDSLPEMEKAQKTAENQMLVDIAKRLQHPVKGLTVIKNTRIFDSEKAELSAPMDVYVNRGRITVIKPTGSPNVSADMTIEAGGRVMTPGLFDMHAHLDRWEAPLNIAAGITTVRDLGNNNEKMQYMIDEIAAGQLLSPHVVPAGFLEGQSPYSAVMGFVVKDLVGAKQAIDWYAERGYPQLKVYNSFPKDIVKDTVAYAHSRGLRVSGHVPAFMRAQDVVEQGFDEIQHINQVLLNFLVTPETDPRTLERFYLPAEKVADLDFDSTKVKDFIKLLKDHNTVIDPTLSTFEFLKHREGELSTSYAPIADHMPPDVKRGFYHGEMKIPDEATAQRYLKSYNKMVEFVGRMYKNNIPIVAGTDALAGFTLQAELELYVKAGITPLQALQIATLNGAKYTRTLNDRGVVSPGRLADIVLFDGDPTQNIGDVRKVALVMSRGYIMYPNEIDKELGIVPFVENPPKAEPIPKTKP